jgi:hypothetical protein
MNTKYAICKGRVLPDKAGLESMFIDWKPPPPIPDQLSDVLPPSIEKLNALGKRLAIN